MSEANPTPRWKLFVELVRLKTPTPPLVLGPYPDATVSITDEVLVTMGSETLCVASAGPTGGWLSRQKLRPGELSPLYNLVNFSRGPGDMRSAYELNPECVNPPALQPVTSHRQPLVHVMFAGLPDQPTASSSRGTYAFATVIASPLRVEAVPIDNLAARIVLGIWTGAGWLPLMHGKSDSLIWNDVLIFPQ